MADRPRFQILWRIRSLMPRPVQTLPLNSPILLQLRDGTLVRIAPGPYGKGIAVVPIAQKVSRSAPAAPRRRGPTGAPRGRKPRPSTVALRERLEQDQKSAKLKDPPQYVKWLIEKDEEIGLPMARTVVYRELKKYR
jgi:hypothetical protein